MEVVFVGISTGIQLHYLVKIIVQIFVRRFFILLEVSYRDLEFEKRHGFLGLSDVHNERFVVLG